jgi:hypothetical protein
MNDTPSPIATRQRHSDASTRHTLQKLGLVGLLLGLALNLLAPVAAFSLVGLGLAVIGFSTLLVGMFLPPRLHWTCSTCGNAVVRTSRRCPVCAADLTAPATDALPDGLHTPLPFRAVVLTVIAVLAIVMIWAGLTLR